MNPDVIDIQPLDNHVLRLIFEGGEIRDYDASTLLEFGIFRELKDPSYFERAYVEFGSVEWPNGQGLSHDTLYLESVPASLTA